MSTDASDPYAVASRKEIFRGAIFDVVSDQVHMPGGGVAQRDYTRNRGAVGVVAVDEAGQVVLIKQYRHPVGRALWELPAGLLDVDNESPELAARRELAEEVDLVAARWEPLVTVHTSPGFSNEVIHLFLARELSAVPAADRHVRADEEAEIEVRRVGLDDAVGLALAGEITNAAAVVGLLAAARVGVKTART